MSTGIQLVALRCASCNGSLAGDAQAVFLYCGSCGAGFEITRTFELNRVNLYFARTSTKAARFFPFWAFDATLELRKREAKSQLFGSPKGLLKRFEEAGTLRFYVPAYSEDIDSKRPRALQLTYEQPDLEFIQNQPRIENFMFSQNDARRIADYLFLSSEIEQKDTVRKLDYNLNLQNPMVIVIGFDQ